MLVGIVLVLSLCSPCRDSVCFPSIGRVEQGCPYGCLVDLTVCQGPWKENGNFIQKW